MAAVGWAGLLEGNDSIDWCQIICCLVSMGWANRFNFMGKDSSLEGGCLDESTNGPGAPMVCAGCCLAMSQSPRPAPPLALVFHLDRRDT